MNGEEINFEIIAGAESFGDGSHPTTDLALQMLYGISTHIAPEKVLDMGVGSGIIAMTAAQLWPHAQVMGVDISASAIAIAQKNICHNGFERRISLIRGEDYAEPKLQPFLAVDVVVCNIAADPIIAMAAGLKNALHIGGCVILSGLLSWRTEEVLAMHRHLGFELLIPSLSSEGWDALLLQKQR